MNIEALNNLKKLAHAAGGEQWEPSEGEDIVFGPDGDSVCICHMNLGHMPDPIYPDQRAAFIAAANPAAILEMIAIAEKAEADFKNFHRSLCARFDYIHDKVDWKRDQVSLEEHIANLVSPAHTPVSSTEHAHYVAWLESLHPDTIVHQTAWNGWEARAGLAASQQTAMNAGGTTIWRHDMLSCNQDSRPTACAVCADTGLTFGKHCECAKGGA